MAHRGLCLGGPLDGRRLEHYEKIYRVPLYEKLPAPEWKPGKFIEQTVEIECFDYVFADFCDAHFWIPDAIRKDGFFENRRYYSEAEFVIKRLASNYRPEGF